MYERASGLVKAPNEDWSGWSQRFASAQPPSVWDREFLQVNSEPLALTLEALKRPQGSIPRMQHDGQVWQWYLPMLLDISARQLESEGKLDEAWDRHFAAVRLAPNYGQDSPSSYSQLPLWAAQSRQTRDRIVAAIKKLQQFDAELPPPTDPIKNQYLRIRPLVTGGPDALVGHVAQEKALTLALWAMMPWERTRALRLLNYVTADDLQTLDRLMSGIAKGEPAIGLLREPTWRTYVQRQYRTWEAKGSYGDWLRTTQLLSEFYQPYMRGDARGWSFVRDVTDRRNVYSDGPRGLEGRPRRQAAQASRSIGWKLSR